LEEPGEEGRRRSKGWSIIGKSHRPETEAAGNGGWWQSVNEPTPGSADTVILSAQSNVT